jgi:ribosomal protein L23
MQWNRGYNIAASTYSWSKVRNKNQRQIKPTKTITIYTWGHNYAANSRLPLGQPLVIMCFAKHLITNRFHKKHRSKHQQQCMEITAKKQQQNWYAKSDYLMKKNTLSFPHNLSATKHRLNAAIDDLFSLNVISFRNFSITWIRPKAIKGFHRNRNEDQI